MLVAICVVTYSYTMAFKVTRERLQWVRSVLLLLILGFSSEVLMVHFLRQVNGQKWQEHPLSETNVWLLFVFRFLSVMVDIGFTLFCFNYY